MEPKCSGYDPVISCGFAFLGGFTFWNQSYSIHILVRGPHVEEIPIRFQQIYQIPEDCLCYNAKSGKQGFKPLRFYMNFLEVNFF